MEIPVEEYFNLVPTEVYQAGVGVLVFGVGVLAWSLFPRSKYSKNREFKIESRRRRMLEKALQDAVILEIKIPNQAEKTNFQVQQKLLKKLFSIYSDPVLGTHSFSGRKWLFWLQKNFSYMPVWFSTKKAFTLQILAEYGRLSFRIVVDKKYLDRIKQSIESTYPGSEIEQTLIHEQISQLSQFSEQYIAYQEMKIEGNWMDRIKTFRDLSADPVDDIVSVLSGLKPQEKVLLNVCCSPVSHYYNRLLQYTLDEDEQVLERSFPEQSSPLQKSPTTHLVPANSEISEPVRSARQEKARTKLFLGFVSIAILSDNDEFAREKMLDIEAVFDQFEQKNMNAFTPHHQGNRIIGTVRSTSKSGVLARIAKGIPQLTRKNFWRLGRNQGNCLGEAELFSLWHLPSRAESGGNLLDTVKYTKIPATRDAIRFRQEVFLPLGSSAVKAEQDLPLGIFSWEDMKRHAVITGGTGSGKSELLKKIVDSLMKKSEDFSLFLVDPHNDFSSEILSLIPPQKREKIVYFNPGKQREKPLGIPFFDVEEQDESVRIQDALDVFRQMVLIDGLYAWGPELENIMRNLFRTSLYMPQQSLSGIDLLLSDEQQIRNTLKYLPPKLQKFWEQSILAKNSNELARYLSTTNNKLGKFLDYAEFTDVVDRQDQKISFDSMIQNGNIFIANLGNTRSDIVKSYFSVFLANKIGKAVERQVFVTPEERKPVILMVDEFQKIDQSDLFSRGLSEYRKFNCSIILANQYSGQLREATRKSIQANTATKVFLRTQNPEDVDFALKVLGEKVESRDIQNVDTGVGYYKTNIRNVPQDVMTIRISRAVVDRAIVKDLDEKETKRTQEIYGKDLDLIEQERKKIHETYYTSKGGGLFHETMKRKKRKEPDTTDNPVIEDAFEMVGIVESKPRIAKRSLKNR